MITFFVIPMSCGLGNEAETDAVVPQPAEGETDALAPQPTCEELELAVDAWLEDNRSCATVDDCQWFDIECYANLGCFRAVNRTITEHDLEARLDEYDRADCESSVCECDWGLAGFPGMICDNGLCDFAEPATSATPDRLNARSRHAIGR